MTFYSFVFDREPIVRRLVLNRQGAFDVTDIVTRPSCFRGRKLSWLERGCSG